MRIRWTADAVQDLNNISLYLEQKRNLATANRVCRSIYAAVQCLRKHPSSGRAGRREQTRELVIGRYVVVYRVYSHAAQILRVWHAAQDRN